MGSLIIPTCPPLWGLCSLRELLMRLIILPENPEIFNVLRGVAFELV